MKDIQSAQDLEQLENFEEWSGALCCMVSPQNTKVVSTERDRTIQKFVITLQHLKSFHQDSSKHKPSLDSFLKSLGHLLEWLLRLCLANETKAKLRIVYEEVIKCPLGRKLPLVQREEGQYGVFYGLKNWESSKLGGLPFNYNPLHF